ncbi:MAG: NAD-dependent epimerase/dehydratase family protein [Leptospiraceae bacterium]|nr:NAD-dependent epimerase/dehydratase family protein [Leptospiraceae bacterium]
MNTDNQKHIVIGGGGAAALATLKALRRRNLTAISVARHKGAPDFLFTSADVLDADSLQRATDGATHIYACMGFPYRQKIWSKVWPRAIENLIAVCAQNNSQLIFLDNIYMYGPAPLQNPMREDHPQKPISRKGQIRKDVADRLLAAMQTGRINALIARAPDFYGPNVQTSVLNVLIEGSIKAGRPIYWPKKLDHLHSLIYIDDLGEALVELATADQSNPTYGQVWHLPVADKPVSTFAALEAIRDAAGSNLPVKNMPGFLKLLLMALIADFRESAEMMYQYEADYIFASAKFKARFPDFAVTSYVDGFQASGAVLRN